MTLTNLGRRDMLVGLLRRMLNFCFLTPVMYSGIIWAKDEVAVLVFPDVLIFYSGYTFV